VNFSGGGFTFTSNGSGDQFWITESSGVGDSVGLDGYVSPGGPFTIGGITPFGSGEQAPLTGTETLHITDASSVDLTGSISWVNITTLGVGGVFNLMGTINLTGISYSGSNSDLGALAFAGSAADVATLQFLPAETLTELKAASDLSTSYSGTIAAVPEPGTIGLGLIGAGAMIVRRSRRVKR
jgi:hypothetical protein